MTSIRQTILDEAQKLRDQAPSQNGVVVAKQDEDEDFPERFSSTGGRYVGYGDVAPDRLSSEYLASMQSWVYGAVNAIADEVANVDLKLMERRAGVDREISVNPVLDLLDRANNFTTKYDLLVQTAQSLELTGEAPWLVAKTQDGTPVAVFVLRSDSLSIIPQKNGQGLIAGYKYRVGGSEVSLAVEDVVFLRYTDPNNPFRGIGPLSAVARTYDVDVYSEEWNKRFFHNSAQPDLVLKTDKKLTKVQRESLLKQMEKRYGGIRNAHKTIILEGGTGLDRIQPSQREMEFLEQQKFTRDKILSIFRVPKPIVAISDDVNRANAEAAVFSFARFTIEPKMRRIVGQLNEFLLPMFPGSENLYLTFESPVPEDKKAQAEINTKRLSAGYITINEARAADGLDPVDGGDVIVLPDGTTLTKKEFDRAMKKVMGGRVPYRVTRQNHFDKKVEEAEEKSAQATEDLAKAVLDAVVSIRSAKKGEAAPKKKDAEQEAKQEKFWTTQIKVADRYEDMMKSRVGSYARSQLKKTLEKLPRKQFNIGEILLNVDDEVNAGVRLFLPILTAVAKEQGRIAMAETGSDEPFDVDNPAVRKFLSDRTFEFAREVNEETNKMLSEQLQEGIRNGEGIPKIKRRVREVFGGLEGYRAERIARTEVLTATNYASESAYKQAGVVEKQWLTALDERTSERCRQLNNKKTSIDGQFRASDGAVVDRPPLHPNCRCTLIPVIK